MTMGEPPAKTAIDLASRAPLRPVALRSMRMIKQNSQPNSFIRNNQINNHPGGKNKAAQQVLLAHDAPLPAYVADLIFFSLLQPDFIYNLDKLAQQEPELANLAHLGS